MELLSPHVLAKGLSGSELVKAFALFMAMGDRDLSKEDDAVQLWNTTVAAEREWLKLSAGQQKYILGGWHPANDLPSTAEYLQTLAGYDDNAVAWTLTGCENYRGNVDFFAAPELVSSMHPVRMCIRQGTPKAQALKQCRNILAALEARWEETIALDGKRGLTQERTESEPARALGILPVGTMICDPSTSESGIIVGAFRGKSRIVYVFVGADGEVDCQYGNSLQTAEGSRGGLPAVTDASGGDPLVKLRETMPALPLEKKSDFVRLMVGLDGKPIAGRKLARRVVKAKRRAGAAAA
jgi:hypothetical protein